MAGSPSGGLTVDGAVYKPKEDNAFIIKTP
jgi:hypothetical protein